MESPPEELQAVYKELRTVARRLLRSEPYDHTLESCELVHQAWARVLDGDLHDKAVQAPREVLALAVTNMRRELVDHARRRRAKKRPWSRVRVSFEDAPLFSERDPETFLAVDMLLDALGSDRRIRNADRKAEVARYALYGGLSEAEIGQLLEMPKSTVGNDLRFVRAWLISRLEPGTAAGDQAQ